MIFGKPSLTKLANNLYRCTQAYANDVLQKYQLSSGTYPIIFALYNKEGANQNQISKDLNIDKAMVTRAVKKLIEIGYLRKEENSEDSRANRLFLTDLGKEVVPLVRAEMLHWNDMITKDLQEKEEERLLDLLSNVLENAKRYKKDNQ